MLTVSNYVKKYGSRVILTIPEITFGSGVVWIRGENGSGKSTFFRSVAGLIPFNGRFHFNDGIDMKLHPVEFRRRVGYSEAEPLYPPFITGKEIYSFVCKARAITEKQASYYASLFGIDSYYTNSCQTYSSGMLKRLSLSMSLLGDPDVIILDEPFITLDAEATAILNAEIIKIAAERNVLFLVSSHQLLSELPGIGFSSMTIENGSLVKTETGR